MLCKRKSYSYKIFCKAKKNNKFKNGRKGFKVQLIRAWFSKKNKMKK